MKTLKIFFFLVDIGFICYWIFAIFNLLPQAYLFKDYENPIMNAWNFSFLPLDLIISATGLGSIFLHSRGKPQWQALALISLTLTFCSGLQAITFWVLRNDFDMNWWLPNLFLMIYPLFFISNMLKHSTRKNSN